MTITTHMIAWDKWVRIAAALFLGMILYSCSNDLAEGTISGGEQQGKAEIVFNIQTNASTTRATESHTTTEDGTDKEKAINSLQVLLYDSSNKFIGKFLAKSSTTKDTYYGSIAYKQMQSCLDANQKFTGKIMVLANCPQFDGSGDLSNLTFDYSASSSYNPANENGYIPMWGVISSPDTQITQDQTVNFGTINLLRSMAKIELVPNNGFGTNQASLESATLNKYNTSGLCVPTGYTTYTSTNEAQQDAFNIPSSVTTSSTSLAFTSSTDGKYIIYIPEMKKEAQSTITLSIKTSTSEAKTYTVNLGGYSDDGSFSNNYYDIIRNHIYRYNLNLDNEDNITFTISIKDWVNSKYATLTPDED